MVQWNSTPAERTARLQAVFDGTTTARDIQHGAATNLLFGVALHAVEKKAQGGTLTDLETLLHDALHRLLPADEVAAAAHGFSAAQTRAGGPRLFAPQVASLPVTADYGRAELLADLPALGRQVMTQPNFSLVKVDDLKDGRDFDSPEFLAGMQEYGGGLTVFTGSPAEGKSDATMSARLYLKQFKCIRRTGDSHFGPSDEIYWMAAAGSDTGIENTYASGEYGGIDNGSERHFPADTYWFRGTVNKTVMAHMECWEKDRGSFWDDIRNALADVAEFCVDCASMSMDGGNDDGAGLAALIGLVGALLGELLNWLIGKDDLIQKREFAFDAAALASMGGVGQSFDFKGQGDAHYKLHVTARIQKKGQLHSCLMGSTGWHKHMNLTFTGREYRLVAPYANPEPSKLYCVFLDDNLRLSICDYDIDSWSGKAEVEPGNVKYVRGGPSGVTMGNGETIHLVAPRPDDPHFFREVTYSPASKSWRHRHSRSLASAVAFTPAIAPSPDQSMLLGMYVSDGTGGSESTADEVISIECSNDVWQGGTKIGAMSSAAAAMATFNGVVHCVFRGHGSNKGLWWTKRTASGSWEGDRTIPGHEAEGAPSLAVVGGKLHCVYRGANDDKIWHMTLDRSDGSWSAASPIPGVLTDDSPSIAGFRGYLVCAYIRPVG